MSDEPNYRIQWKGNVSGPYTRTEVEHLLFRGEISLLHRVEVGGQWLGVGEFLGHAARMPRPILTDSPATPVAAWETEVDTVETSVSGVGAYPTVPRLLHPAAGTGSDDGGSTHAPFSPGGNSGSSDETAATSSSVPTADNTDFIIQAGYVLCGLCFLLPFLATIPALIAAFWLHTQEREKQAKQLFILCPALTVAGIIFWLLLKKLF